MSYQITIDGTTYTGAKPRAIPHGGTVYPANCRNPAWVEVPEPEPAPPADPTPDELERAARVEGLRDAYRQSTRGICALAGMEPVDKLEDMAFVDARGAAMQKDFVTTSVLCDNLTYALFQLYRLDGDDAWSRI